MVVRGVSGEDAMLQGSTWDLFRNTPYNFEWCILGQNDAKILEHNLMAKRVGLGQVVTLTKSYHKQIWLIELGTNS